VRITPKHVATVATALAATIGAIVLTGWYLGAPALLRIHPAFVAMQFNTALAFTLMAAGIVASMRGAPRAAIACGLVVAMFSGVATMQYLGVSVVNLDGLMWLLGVDPELRPLTAIKTSSPGRMAPNTALCFLLASASVACVSALPRSRRAAHLCLLAGVAIGGIALLALLGYLGGAPSAYGWGGLTRMAVHTAVAMVAIGVGVASLGALRLESLGETVINRLPALVAVGGVVMTLGLWLAAADYQAEVRRRAVASAAARLRDEIADEIRPRLLALARMRQRWEFRKEPSRRDFESEARTNLVHFPGYRAIAWLTSTGEVGWVVADGAEHLARGALATEVVRATLRDLVRRPDSLASGEAVDPLTRDATLIAALPLHRPAESNGYLVGVMQVARLMELALRDSGIEGYDVRIESARGVLHESAGGRVNDRRGAEAVLDAHGIRWMVRVSPSDGALAPLDSPLPAIVGLLGLLVTMVLVFALRTVQVARQRELERLAAVESEKDAAVARERAAELAGVNAKLRQEITERERAEQERESMQQQLSQAQKMEAVGQLAGGVAHDFNNLLTVITSYCELLLEDIPADDARRSDVEEVLRAAGSAARLTRQLLAFSRQQILQPEALDLNVAVAELEKMLRRLLPADIGLTPSLSPDLGTVTADRGQLEQVIVNLVVNARDAMPHGGQLTIGTANVDLDDTYIARQHFASPDPGRYVVLSVSDTGHGMDAATQARIFEPFFTTKEKGHGTGLGLSTVYGIVKQSGGYVWLYSEVGRGTTFKIYLPRVEARTGARLAAPLAREVTGGDETVLLVEDEEAVRTIAQRILERHGYRVLAAANGADALRIEEEIAGAIDLVLTDLVMPKMGGQEMVKRLRSGRPAIKTLMMSGYTSDQSFRQRVLEEGIPFLEKPFTPGVLLAKVRAVLDAEGVREASLIR
jgi:signal transduction histidine kinase/ActR/RegA family two-component response regulator